MPTVRIYRVTHAKYALEPYSGIGGPYAASRWSNRGTPVSFAADTLALAVLEKIAGAGQFSRLGEMVYAAADLDTNRVWAPPREELPPDWDRRPPGSTSRTIGDQWIKSGRSVAMRVPSGILPEGSNYVLNPSHSDFQDVISVHEATPLELDERVLIKLVRPISSARILSSWKLDLAG